MVFAHTFKYKTCHNMFYRRIRRVAYAVLDKDRNVWCLTKISGAYCEVPADMTIVLIGRKVILK